jgi:hypothetical protein
MPYNHQLFRKAVGLVGVPDAIFLDKLRFRLAYASNLSDS